MPDKNKIYSDTLNILKKDEKGSDVEKEDETPPTLSPEPENEIYRNILNILKKGEKEGEQPIPTPEEQPIPTPEEQPTPAPEEPPEGPMLGPAAPHPSQPTGDPELNKSLLAAQRLREDLVADWAKEQAALPNLRPGQILSSDPAQWTKAHVNRTVAARRVSEAKTTDERLAAVVEYGKAVRTLSTDFARLDALRLIDKDGKVLTENWNETLYEAYRDNESEVKRAEKIYRKWLLENRIDDPEIEEALELEDLNRAYAGEWTGRRGAPPRALTKQPPKASKFRSLKEAKDYVERVQRHSKKGGYDPLLEGPIDAATFTLRGASFFDWLKKAGEITGAAGAEAFQWLHQGGGKHPGQFMTAALEGAMFEDEYGGGVGYGRNTLGLTTEELMESGGLKGDATYGFYTGASIVPDIVLGSKGAKPALAWGQKFLREAAISGSKANHLLKTPGGKVLNLYMQGEGAALATSFGALGFTKEYALTGGDMHNSILAGTTFAALPGVHQFTSKFAGNALAKMLSNKAATEWGVRQIELATVEQLAGLGGVMAVAESAHLEEYVKASPERRKEILAEMSGRLLAFAAPAPIFAMAPWAKGYGRPSEAARARWRIEGEGVLSKEALESAKRKLAENILVESLKEDTAWANWAQKGIQRGFEKQLGIDGMTPKEANRKRLKARLRAKYLTRELEQKELAKKPSERADERTIDEKILDFEAREGRPPFELEVAALEKGTVDDVLLRKPWELTREEFKEINEGRAKAEGVDLDAVYEDVVAEAIDGGKQVTEEVAKSARLWGKWKESPGPIIEVEGSPVEPVEAPKPVEGEVLPETSLAAQAAKDAAAAEVVQRYRTIEEAITEEPVVPELTPKPLEEVGPKPEVDVAEAKRVTEAIKAVEAEGDIARATKESWSDTHERTDVTGFLSVKRYNEMVADGTIKELPDGSSHWPDGPSTYERFIKEKDGGIYRTTLLSEKAAAEPTAEVPVEPTAEPPPPTVEAPLIPPEVEGGRRTRMGAIARREIGHLLKEGFKEEADALAKDPNSFYEVMPTRMLAEAINRFNLIEVEAELKGKTDVLEAILRGRKVVLLRKAWTDAKLSGNKKLEGEAKEDYDAELNEFNARGTFFGQLVQSLRYFGKTPEVMADLFDKRLVQDGKEQMTEGQRKEIIELTERIDAAQELADKDLEAAQKDPSTGSTVKALKTKMKVAGLEAIRTLKMAELNPQAVTDSIITMMQGKFLTPTTLAVNILGNIVPLPLRVSTRVAAKGIQVVDEFFSRNKNKEELSRLEGLRDAAPEGSLARKKAQKAVDDMEGFLDPRNQIRLSPFRGTYDKWIKGFAFKGLGVKRLWETYKAPAGEKKNTFGNPLYDDVPSSLILGNRGANQYEVSSGVNPVRTLNMNETAKRLKRFVSEPRNAEAWWKAGRDLAEGLMGWDADMFFRFLAMGDLPFRHGEHYRVIRELGLNKGLTEEQIGLAQQMPEIFFSEKEVALLWDKASMATFQNENEWTNAANRFNSFVNRGPGKPAYMVFRGVYMPYQKTLINISAESLGYTPLGIGSALYYQSKYGRNHPKARMAWGRVLVGQMAWILANKYIDDGLMTADMDPYMTDDKSKKLRYMSDMAYPHGTLNITAIRDGRNKGREGDTMINLRDFGPFGKVLLANAALRMKMEKMTPEARKKIENSWMGWQKLAMGQQTLMGQTFSQSFNHSFASGAVELSMGVKEMASRALSGSGEDTEGMRKSGLSRAIRPLANAMPNLVPFFPNTMEWFYKLDSPYKQNFRPEDGFVRAVADKITKRLSVVGFADTPDEPAYVNMWGQKVQQLPRGTKQFSTGERLLRMTFGRALGDPRKVGGKYEKGQWISDPASSEVYRLWRKFRKGDEVPSTPSRYLSIDGKSYELTKQQYHDYSVAVGQTRLNGTDDTGEGKWRGEGMTTWRKPKTPIVGVYGLVSSDDWEPLGRDPGGAKLQVKALQNAYDQGRVHGKNIFLSELEKMNKANGKPPLFGLKEIKDPSGAIRDVLE